MKSRCTRYITHAAQLVYELLPHGSHNGSFLVRGQAGSFEEICSNLLLWKTCCLSCLVNLSSCDLKEVTNIFLHIKLPFPNFFIAINTFLKCALVKFNLKLRNIIAFQQNVSLRELHAY